MSTNRYFNLSRFGLLLKHDLLEMWKSYVRAFCIIFLTALAVYFMALYSYSHLLNDDVLDIGVKDYIRFQIEIFAFFYCLYLLIKASQFTELLNTKEGRIRQLMLPATSLEKFISRALGVTIVPTILFMVALPLADMAHFAFFPFLPNLPEELKIWVVPELWKEVCAIPVVSTSTGLSATINSAYEASAIYVILSTLVSHSIFILFGNIFEKHAFIIVVLLSSVSSLFGTSIFKYAGVISDSGLEVINESGGVFETYLRNGACFCLLVFIWWLSYKVFSRKQVIQPKFRL